MEWKHVVADPPPKGRYLVLTGFNEDDIQEACYDGKSDWIYRNKKFECQAYANCVNWYVPYPKLPSHEEVPHGHFPSVQTIKNTLSVTPQPLSVKKTKKKASDG